MKKQILLMGFSLFFFSMLNAQVDIDKPVNLSGGVGDRKMTNLELPVNPTDAASKEYVDAEIAANSGGSGPVVGELYGGGVVYAVYKDANGDEHGLIVSLVNNSTGAAWSNITNTLVGTTSWNGAANTTAIIGQVGHTSGAAKICNDYTGGSQTDWFLPAISQLDMLWTNLYVVNQTLTATGGAELMIANFYLSSSEYDSANVRLQNFLDGDWSFAGKSSTSYPVRCVRVF